MKFENCTRSCKLPLEKRTFLYMSLLVTQQVGRLKKGSKSEDLPLSKNDPCFRDKSNATEYVMRAGMISFETIPFRNRYSVVTSLMYGFSKAFY